MSVRYGYGYGQSKPQMNYHQANSEYVTTVIEEMSRMTVNQQTPTDYSYGYGGSDVQKNMVCKEEVAVKEENCGSEYKGGYHAGGDAAAVQKLEYKQHEAFEEKTKKDNSGGYDNSYYGGGDDGTTYDYKLHEAFEEKTKKDNGYYGGGSDAVQKIQYKQHEEKKDGDYYGGGVQKQQKHDYKQHGAFEESAGGYNYNGYRHGGGSGAMKQKHDYHQAEHGYQHGGAYDSHSYHAVAGGGGDMHKYGDHQKHTYGYGKDDGYNKHGGDYQYGNCDYYASGFQGKYGKAAAGARYGGYGKAGYAKMAYGGGADKQHQYAGHASACQDAYGKAATGAMYGPAYYGGGGNNLKAGFGGEYRKKAAFGSGAMMQKHGYKQETTYHGGAAGGGYQYNKGHHDEAVYESESESEESDYEEDEEAFGHHAGAVHGQGAYKCENKPGGGVRQYESYERHKNLDGGHRYESYHTTTHEGYAAAGMGYDACAPPRKNKLFF